MDLSSLKIILTAPDGQAKPGGDFFGNFVVHTCLRSIEISLEDTALRSIIPQDQEALCGKEAYHFLLKFGCGLLSKSPGESEVFCQIKQAWSEQQARFRPMTPFMQKWFSDIKKVRTETMQGIGHASYAASLQKLWQKSPINEGLLVVGAGVLAQQILSCYQNKAVPLYLWNRHYEKATLLADKLSGVMVLEGFEQVMEAASSVGHVVFCVPYGCEVEDLIYSRLVSGQKSPQIVHFGDQGGSLAQRSELLWKSLLGPKFVTLREAFAVQAELSALKKFSLKNAESLCLHLAEKRWSQASIETHHGWEDLFFDRAFFASVPL